MHMKTEVISTLRNKKLEIAPIVNSSSVSDFFKITLLSTCS